MRTFAVVRQMESPAVYWDGHVYDFCPLNDGRLVRSIGETNGKHYAYFIVCGAALQEKAEQEAEAIGGYVVEVESEYWPGPRDILAAIKNLIPKERHTLPRIEK
jgi:hypothetical protein